MDISSPCTSDHLRVAFITDLIVDGSALFTYSRRFVILIYKKINLFVVGLTSLFVVCCNNCRSTCGYIYHVSEILIFSICLTICVAFVLLSKNILLFPFALEGVPFLPGVCRSFSFRLLWHKFSYGVALA